ncbi:MAG: sugar phosphate isomerase/epimerase [Clostridia bacterium]|nr:sugar phosphate isomerase/epimerase [Clostridia bacterium]
MANFIFSAFSDEIDSDFDKQILAVKALGIDMIELRGVNGKSFIELTDDEVDEVKQKLDANGITLSALGTPIGKMYLDSDFSYHKSLLFRIMDIGDKLGCKVLRMFSFYPADNMSDDDFRSTVFEYVEELLDIAESRGFILCHENEKDIFGYSPERELELLEHFGGRLKAVLDPGNFSFCFEDASKGYPLLKDYIHYFHIKDADESCAIVPPGKGVAGLEDILRAVNNDRDGDVILTMEPHLMNFTGLSGLSKLDDIHHVYSFETPFDAFRVATEAVREMIDRL